jgi:hypothetical protein
MTNLERKRKKITLPNCKEVDDSFHATHPTAIGIFLPMAGATEVHHQRENSPGKIKIFHAAQCHAGILGVASSKMMTVDQMINLIETIHMSRNQLVIDPHLQVHDPLVRSTLVNSTFVCFPPFSLSFLSISHAMLCDRYWEEFGESDGDEDFVMDEEADELDDEFDMVYESHKAQEVSRPATATRVRPESATREGDMRRSSAVQEVLAKQDQGKADPRQTYIPHESPTAAAADEVISGESSEIIDDDVYEEEESMVVEEDARVPSSAEQSRYSANRSAEYNNSSNKSNRDEYYDRSKVHAYDDDISDAGYSDEFDEEGDLEESREGHGRPKTRHEHLMESNNQDQDQDQDQVAPQTRSSASPTAGASTRPGTSAASKRSGRRVEGSKPQERGSAGPAKRDSLQQKPERPNSGQVRPRKSRPLSAPISRHVSFEPPRRRTGGMENQAAATVDRRSLQSQQAAAASQAQSAQRKRGAAALPRRSLPTDDSPYAALAQQRYGDGQRGSSSTAGLSALFVKRHGTVESQAREVDAYLRAVYASRERGQLGPVTGGGFGSGGSGASGPNANAAPASFEELRRPVRPSSAVPSLAVRGQDGAGSMASTTTAAMPSQTLRQEEPRTRHIVRRPQSASRRPSSAVSRSSASIRSGRADELRKAIQSMDRPPSAISRISKKTSSSLAHSMKELREKKKKEEAAAKQQLEKIRAEYEFTLLKRLEEANEYCLFLGLQRQYRVYRGPEALDDMRVHVYDANGKKARESSGEAFLREHAKLKNRVDTTRKNAKDHAKAAPHTKTPAERAGTGKVRTETKGALRKALMDTIQLTTILKDQIRELEKRGGGFSPYE